MRWNIWYVGTFIFIHNSGQSIKMLSVWLPPREDICYSTHGWSTTLWVEKKHAERSITTLVPGWWDRDLFLMLRMCFRGPPALDNSGRSEAICVFRWAIGLLYFWKESPSYICFGRVFLNSDKAIDHRRTVRIFLLYCVRWVYVHTRAFCPPGHFSAAFDKFSDHTRPHKHNFTLSMHK